MNENKQRKNDLSVEEISSLRPPDRVPMFEWIEKNRILQVSTSAEPGPKKVGRTPFIVPILEWWRDEFVREIVVEKSAQLGITDLAVDIVGHTAANDPCPMAVFLADESTAQKVMVDRIQPMLRTCKDLDGLVDEQRLTQKEAYLRNGFNLSVSWASSIAQTASRPFKHVIMDEINKPGYAASGDEGNAIGRLRQRQETFADRKALLLSTPTLEEGNISRELETCEIIYEWGVPCHACGVVQPLRWSPQLVGVHQTGGVVWDGGTKATRGQVEQTARYQCGHCGELWTTIQKNEAILKGVAIPRSGIAIARPVKVGLHLSRLVSLFPGGRLENMIHDFCESKRSVDPKAFQNFVNSSLGEPWVFRVDVHDAEEIRRSKLETIASKVVPDDAVAVAITVDMQKVGFWYLVRAHARSGKSWMIDCGYISSWAELEKLIFETQWPYRGQKIKPWRVMIDSGGSHRMDEYGNLTKATQDLYSWWWANYRRGIPIFISKGSSKTLNGNLVIGKHQATFPNGKPMKAGLRVVEIDTIKCKDIFFGHIEKCKDDETMAWYCHSDTPEEYFNHITSEEKRLIKGDERYFRKSGKENHWLDCEMMQVAVTDIGLFGGINCVFRPKLDKPASTEPSKPKPQPQIRDRSFDRDPFGVSGWSPFER